MLRRVLFIVHLVELVEVARVRLTGDIGHNGRLGRAKAFPVDTLEEGMSLDALERQTLGRVADQLANQILSLARVPGARQQQ